MADWIVQDIPLAPAHGCIITGASRPAEGPYVNSSSSNGLVCLSKSAVRDAARALDLVLNEQAEAVFERLVAELVRERENVARASELLTLSEAELSGTRDALAAATERVEHLDRALAKTKTFAQAFEEFTAATKSTKKGEAVVA